MPFNIGKCDAMALNRSPTGLVFKLYGNKLKIVESHKYIGVTISTKLTNSYVEHFNVIFDNASNRLWQITHIGFSKDGLRPEPALKHYQLLIWPILEYGAQVLTYEPVRREPVRPDIFNPNFFQLFNLFFERFWSTFPVLTGETGS